MIDGLANVWLFIVVQMCVESPLGSLKPLSKTSPLS